MANSNATTEFMFNFHGIGDKNHAKARAMVAALVKNYKGTFSEKPTFYDKNGNDGNPIGNQRQIGHFASRIRMPRSVVKTFLADANRVVAFDAGPVSAWSDQALAALEKRCDGLLEHK